MILICWRLLLFMNRIVDIKSVTNKLIVLNVLSIIKFIINLKIILSSFHKRMKSSM